jgi:hypothetical protein
MMVIGDMVRAVSLWKGIGGESASQLGDLARFSASSSAVGTLHDIHFIGMKVSE